MKIYRNRPGGLSVDTLLLDFYETVDIIFDTNVSENNTTESALPFYGQSV